MVKRAGGALLWSIRIDPQLPRPMSSQLHHALRELILTGAIAVGERLPASRTLARELKLSRTTVIEAFDRLTAEGLIESRVGAGAFVSAALSAPRPRALPRKETLLTQPPRLAATVQQRLPQLADRSQLPRAARAFTTALPAFDEFPMAQWARLAARHWRSPRAGVMGYGEPLGHAPLREAIALHLRANRGIVCDAAQVFIFGGAQQAFSLVAELLLDPGDAVWFENPGAIGARNSLVAAGAQLVPVRVDEQGLDVPEGLALAPRFRLAFVTPSHQQPLGVVMSLTRRFALLQAAEEAGAWVIEDDYDGEFSFGGEPLPTLKSVDAGERVVYVGTFSKSLFPSLRLGYLLAPPALVPALEALMCRVLPGVPTHTQAVVAEFIGEGHFSAHLRRMRRLYAERHEALQRAAATHLEGALCVVRSASGLHTVAHFASGFGAARDEHALVAAAAARGVTLSPIGRYVIAPVPEAQRGVVLGFGGIAPGPIDKGVRALAAAVDDLRRAKGWAETSASVTA
ncbi:MAG: PLP-dependent aminotransferase family protein [Rubrivivax sp.]|nr:PLP-dependent aminotransferase family protein [Rubrivivax sp.]